MIVAAVDGFLLMAGLIVAIGAQNAFVIRQGILGRFVFWICLFCAVSDAVLTWGGVFGLAAVANLIPFFVPVMTYGGVAFLGWFGVTALWRAMRPGRTTEVAAAAAPSLGAAILTCAGFTLLNPHVYLDTVILVGSVANARPPDDRLAFGFGASSASFLWFFGLGFGAMVLKPWLDRPRVWQLIDGVIAAIMLFLAVRLLIG